MRSSKFYGMIVKIKNKITLFTLLAKNLHICPPQNLVYHFLKILSIFFCTKVVFKKTTLEEFLHYMQVYLLIDIPLMHQEAKSGGQDI